MGCGLYNNHDKTCFYIVLKNNGTGCEGKSCRYYTTNSPQKPKSNHKDDKYEGVV